MKNKLNSALALLCILFSFFSRFASTVDSKELTKISKFHTNKDEGRFLSKLKTTSRGVEDPLHHKRSLVTTTANLEGIENSKVGKVKSCHLSDEVLEQIQRPSASNWIVDDDTVKLLNNNLQPLIQCTRPKDTIEFRTQKRIKIKETIKIFHELEFVRGALTSSNKAKKEANVTAIKCPKLGPLLSIRASRFTVTGLKITRCASFSNIGIIVVHPRSKVTFNELHIYKNSNTIIYVKEGANVTVAESHFETNHSPLNGSVIHAKSEAFINIVNSTIKSNRANGGYGGAIYVGHNVVFLMSNCRVTSNSAAHGGGLYFELDSTFDLVNSKVQNNYAVMGGGIYLYQYINATINGSSITDNYQSWGGGIYLKSYNNVSIIGSRLAYNHVSIDGGGMYVWSYNNLTIINSSLYHNYANYRGGGMYLESYNNVTMIGSKILRNTAEYNGGGIVLIDSNNATIDGSKLKNNKAYRGGAMYLETKNNANITNSLLSNNKGEYNETYYGVFYKDDENKLIIKNSTISNGLKHLDELVYSDDIIKGAQNVNFNVSRRSLKSV